MSPTYLKPDKPKRVQHRRRTMGLHQGDGTSLVFSLGCIDVLWKRGRQTYKVLDTTHET